MVHMILSARSLPYAHYCVDSLLRHSVDPLRLRLITDGPEDAIALREELARLAVPAVHEVTVHDQAEADERAEDRLARYPLVRQFRRGHPCWRKITDPGLFASDGEEMVILDPDLYFPNPFRFEPTPSQGLLLMWQRPNCLLPPETVRAAIRASFRLAHHVDIGVAHARAPLDWQWLEGFLGAIGGADIPRVMHVEAIVWSAMAMHVGGGHLNPSAWRCWHRTQLKRILLKLRTPGAQLLRLERVANVKCFHAGGVAKQWIAEAHAAGILAGDGRQFLEATRTLPFVELPPSRYEAEQALKEMLRRVGYYRAIGDA
jgi:hypothetical protein